MNKTSVAPCGIICDICIGFQRTKNTCVGCNNFGFKPYHCNACSITSCPEKNGDKQLLCNECTKFPCKRIKSLDKRYIIKYGESPIKNLQSIKEKGLKEFILTEEEKWKCDQCGNLLCVHRDKCLKCGAENRYFPANKTH